MPRRTRILLLIPHLGGGGAEQVIALLAKGLSPVKYEVHLGLVTQAETPSGSVPAWITVHPLGAHRVRAGALKLLRLVGRLQPDVLLSGMAHLNFLVLLLKPFLPAATRILVRQNSTVSSSLAQDKLPFYTRWLYRWLYPRADRILCPSCAMAADLALLAGLDEQSVVVLPNPLDCAGIESALRAPSRWAGQGPYLLAVGRLAPEKGFDLLLEAMVRVIACYPAARLTLLGSGPQEEQLKQLAHRLGLDNVVNFAGYQQPPYSYYPGATLFVLPSRHEGMPNALMEALVGNIPVVATPASGGVKALLEARKDAWLAREVSTPALADALLQALDAVGDSAAKNRTQREAPQPFVTPRSSRTQCATSRRTVLAGEFEMPVDEFDFAHALAAYEQVFDAVCPESRP